MRILVVDDEKQIRRILSVLLAEHGYEVMEARSGEEALRLQRDLQPALVLLDLSMPGMDGLETLKLLMQTQSPPEVIMMTAFGTIRSAVEAIRLGAYDYLSKPFDNEALLLTVDRALERRRLSREVEDLRTELETRYGFSEIIGLSPQMQEVEIGDLALDAQAKLLRALQERQIMRLGGAKAHPVDVRIIAATNRNLEQAVSRRSEPGYQPQDTLQQNASVRADT